MSERVLTITPERLSGLMRIGEGVVLVDVRSPAEYRAGHVPGATLLPPDELDVDRVVARTGTTEIGAALTLQRQAQIAVGLLNELGSDNVIRAVVRPGAAMRRAVAEAEAWLGTSDPKSGDESRTH